MALNREGLRARIHIYDHPRTNLWPAEDLFRTRRAAPPTQPLFGSCPCSAAGRRNTAAVTSAEVGFPGNPKTQRPPVRSSQIGFPGAPAKMRTASAAPLRHLQMLAQHGFSDHAQHFVGCGSGVTHRIAVLRPGLPAGANPRGHSEAGQALLSEPSQRARSAMSSAVGSIQRTP